MQWRFWDRGDGMEAGEKARLLHSQWLSEAIQSGRSYPRIPVRPEITGGFSRLMTKPGGPKLAERWWEAALNRMD